LTRWEYHRTHIRNEQYNEEIETLNDLGDLGWELIDVDESDFGTSYLFKRQKDEGLGITMKYGDKEDYRVITEARVHSINLLAEPPNPEVGVHPITLSDPAHAEFIYSKESLRKYPCTEVGWEFCPGPCNSNLEHAQRKGMQRSLNT
jgi:hypothetical protein